MDTIRKLLNEIEIKIAKSQNENYSEGYRKKLLNDIQNDICENNLYNEFTHDLVRVNHNKINLNTLNKNSGIYLIGCQFVDENQKITYNLKIGMSSNLAQRVKQYRGYNPGFILIDAFYTNEAEKWEADKHELLAKISNHCYDGTKEWFAVKKEIYDMALEYGFDFITKYIAKLLD